MAPGDSRPRRRRGDGDTVLGPADGGGVPGLAQLPAGATQPVPVHRLRLRRRLGDARVLLLPAPGLPPGPGAMPLRRVQARAQPHRAVPRPGAGHDPQRLRPAQPMRWYIMHDFRTNTSRSWYRSPLTSLTSCHFSCDPAEAAAGEGTPPVAGTSATTPEATTPATEPSSGTPAADPGTSGAPPTPTEDASATAMAPAGTGSKLPELLHAAGATSSRDMAAGTIFVAVLLASLATMYV